MERRLAAILAADVVGYSRLVEIDEADALDRLRRLRAAVLDPAIARHRGRVVKVLGDGVLAEFGSAVGAMRCALEVQTGLAADPSALRLRIGVNVGDVVVEGDDLLGDGINVAARLETLAEPGGIALSAAVHEHVVGRIDAVFEDAGNCALKNIDRPVHVWRWRPEGLPRGSAETMPLALPDKPSIVVLPFDDLSGGGEHAFLADGIAEAITATLSRIRSFFVIARNSAFTYRGQATNVQEIGRALGVAYVLEGSVQRAGPRVRITVQLVETEGGSHLWAEKYDGSIEDVFDLQDRITEQVAGALQPSIRLAEIARVRRKRPQELGAYDYAMRAMPSVWVLEKEQAARALELLDAALELDPDYPLARALAAWCWAQRAVYNWVDDIDDAKSRAVRLAEQAAGDAADDPLILAILGAVHTFARHYGTARVLLDRAVTLDPNAAWALSRLGWLEVYADRPEAAEPHFRRALRLSPLDPMNFNNYVGLGSARQVAGDDAGAADLFLRALEERPNAHWIHRNLAPALYGAGRREEAERSLAVVREAYPGLTASQFRHAMVFSPRVLERISAQLVALGLPEA